MQLGILPEQGGGLANLSRSGQDTRFFEQYVRLYAREFEEVHYFSYARKRAERNALSRNEPIAENFRLHCNPGFHRWLYGLALPVVHARALRRCSVTRVMQATGAIPAWLARLFFGVPFVTTYGYHYGTHYLADSPEGRWRARLFQRRAEWALRRADGVIVTTAALADYVGRFAPRERITLIPNSVDATRFSPAPGESGSAGRQRLIAVGSLTVRKNHNLLVEAVALTGRDKIEVVILGTGPEEETLRRLAADKRVTLELPGIVPNEQLPEWLRRADAYLITSHHEGHPKSLLEAMSVGLPCIGTDVPGIRDILVEGETGRLCPSEPAPLAAAINAVLSDRQVARAIGAQARRFILENHDAQVVIAREIAFLKAVARRSTSKETV